MTGKTDKKRRQISRRLVLFFPGFEPLGAEQHRARFERALSKTAPVYGSHFSATGLQNRASGVAGFSVSASGADWQTITDIAIFDWSSLLEHFAQRPIPARFTAGIAALLTLILNGTLLRYLKTSWRYGFFFFYPLFLLATCALAGLLASAIFQSTIASLTSGISAFCAGIYLFSRKAHLLLMMDDWAFAARLAAGGDPVIEKMRQLFATALQAEMQRDADEVVVVGHSLGCVFAVDALSKAKPQANLPVGLMTTGSSLLKIVLDARAHWLRESTKRVAAKGWPWLEIQALNDVISFYRSNPAAAAGAQSAKGLKVLRIEFRKMLLPKTYKRVKLNLFRTHRQFVLAAECPYFYSLHQIACGPDPFDLVWKSNGLPDHVRPLRKQKIT
jgi:hypothetical protein